MYKALYRKWRPLNFSDVVGQDHVTQSLKRQVSSGRLSHAYLFTGTRGTGKTSCAKILARAVNCENPQGGDPCNACPSCRGILDGSILDVIEMDAASNNGVDNIRDLRDELIYTPAIAKKRVYIIDEVHMLSTPAFNALLKTLEEPPAHVLFILATTELHKVPATVLSRCQKFAFRRILPAQIAQRLSEVSIGEGIRLSPDAAALIARVSDGSMRDALSILDQCAALSREIDIACALSVLGLSGDEMASSLIKMIGDRDTKGALTHFSSLYAAGKDISAVLDELCALMRDLLMSKIASPGDYTQLSGLDEKELKTLGASFTPERIIYCMDELNRTISGLGRSQNRRIDAEVCLIRLCDESVSGLPAAISARVSALEQEIRKMPSGGVSKVPAEILDNKREDRKKPAKEKPAAVLEESLPKAVKPDSTADFWPTLLDRLKETVSPPEYTHLKLSEAVFDGQTLTLYLPEEFSRLYLHGRGAEDKVRDEAKKLQSGDIKVKITQKAKRAPEGASKLDEWLKQNGSLENVTIED